jgi:hypothetical protein
MLARNASWALRMMANGIGLGSSALIVWGVLLWSDAGEDKAFRHWRPIMLLVIRARIRQQWVRELRMLTGRNRPRLSEN